MNYVVFDHKFYTAGDLDISFLILNNHFQLDQKIWYRNNELPLFAENMALLYQKAELLGLEWPDFMEDQNELLRLMRRLLNKNRFYKTGITLFRLIWERSDVHYLIQAEPSEEKLFPLMKAGLFLNFSEIFKFSATRFASLDIFNRMLWDHYLSGLKGTLFSNSIILNEKGFVCEAIGANIFFLKGNSIITPSPETGCYIDTIRQKILEAVIGLNFQVVESGKITRGQVFGMDEVFMASEVRGMQWVIGIESKRYMHSRSDEVNIKLNELLSGSV